MKKLVWNGDRAPENALAGKRIIFLGSSVTYGSASGGVTFADFLAQRHGCESIKEAVSGTTLVDNGETSYVSRMKNMQVEGKVDLFVCQLSTNDASRGMPLGTVSGSMEKETFDTQTVAGAIEYIIAYAKEIYGCPVAFYTNPRYDSGAYGDMVALLYAIGGKWDIAVLDFWNDEAFNAVTEEKRSVYMNDAIHPTRLGYEELWTPVFKEALASLV